MKMLLKDLYLFMNETLTLESLSKLDKSLVINQNSIELDKILVQL